MIRGLLSKFLKAMSGFFTRAPQFQIRDSTSLTVSELSIQTTEGRFQSAVISNLLDSTSTTKLEEAKYLSDTKRGSGGFGSSGK